MSYNGFAGYPCHPTQLSTQLSLMTSNSNNSDSPCCSSGGGTDSQNNNTNVTNNSNNSSNNSANEENPIPSALQTTQTLSSSSPSVCGLTSPYDPRVISGYPRLGSLYGPSYPDLNTFYNSGAPPFYSLFGNPYDLKDPNGNGWTPLPQTACYPYDPTLCSPYGERYGAMDSATRRKNVTRDSTTTLKAWLHEHRKNPYPTKGEKIMLAIITKMTLTQVSTWFANARRRLKKENKMTWEPRNRSSDGYDSDDKDSFRDTDDNSSYIGDNSCLNGSTKLSVKKESDSITEKTTTGLKAMNTQTRDTDSPNSYSTVKENIVDKSHSEHIPNGQESKDIVSHQINNSRTELIANHLHVKHDSSQNMLDGVTNIESIGQRPKIWSLAQTATSDSPPYSGKIGPLTHTDWTPALPGCSDVSIPLTDYQRDCRQWPRFAPTNLRKCGQSWPEDHCIANLGSARSAMHLFTSDSIGSHNYFNSHPSKAVTGGSFPVYGTDFRISSETVSLSEASHSFSNAISTAVHLQTQDNSNNNDYNNSTNHK